MAAAAPNVWKHIGLHGHSVGTFVADPGGIQWKSAVMGGRDDDDVVTSRALPANILTSAKWTVFGKSGHIRIQSKSDKHPRELRFDGFNHADYDRIRDVFKRQYNLDLTKHVLSSTGVSFGNVEIEDGNIAYKQCILEDADEEGEEFEPRDGDEMMSVNMTEVSQCVLPGNNRNEIELQFHESDTVEAGTDQLVAVRFYIPPDPDTDPSDRDAPTAAELFQQRIMKNANIKKTTGDVIVEFDAEKGTFLTPRGRYSLELYDSFLRMRGNKYDYKIKYDAISRLFLLPKPDDVHMAFVIALDKPIRQGQQRYQHLVMQTTKEQAEVTVNLDEDILEKEYNKELQPIMYGALSNLVAKTFKIIAKKKVFIPGKFANANQQACVKCALRASEGHLYPLEKQFIFIHKPTVLVRFDEVESVEFQRYAGGQGSTRNFDLCVSLRRTTGDGGKEYVFSGIDRSDYTGLYNFLSGKKIKIKNLQDTSGMEAAPSGPIYDENIIYGIKPGEEGGQEMEESSEDEDYGTGESEESESMSEDDDDLGSGFEDSDLDDYGGSKKKKKKKTKTKEKAKPTKKKKKRPAEEESDDDDEEEEEVTRSPKKKSSKKRKSADKSPAASPKRKKKDPNAPKNAKSSYMFFAQANRPKIKEDNPDASFGDLGKLVGEAWKKLGDEEKKKYESQAEKDKARYKEEMKDYTPPKVSKEESKKAGKKKKAKKDPNAPKGAKSSFMFFSNAMRSKIKEEHKDASFGEMGKLVGEAWKKLGDEEKKEYEEQAAKDKTRYKEAMAAYKEKKKEEEDAADDSDDHSDSDDSSDNDSDDDSDSD